MPVLRRSDEYIVPNIRCFRQFLAQPHGSVHCTISRPQSFVTHPEPLTDAVTEDLRMHSLPLRNPLNLESMLVCPRTKDLLGCIWVSERGPARVDVGEERRVKVSNVRIWALIVSSGAHERDAKGLPALT